MFDTYTHVHLADTWNRVKILIRDTYYKFKYPVRITVVWPNGEVIVGPGSRNHNSVYGTYYQLVESADPNDHYRPELERTVGRQHVDWEWGISRLQYDILEIMFKKQHEKMAVYYHLKWR
jgi:hypothetical protein